MATTNLRRADSEAAEEAVVVVEVVLPKEVELDLRLAMPIKSQDIRGREQTMVMKNNLKKRAKSSTIKELTVKLMKLMKAPITTAISMVPDPSMKELL